VGDVFLIPLDAARVGVGQIVAEYLGGRAYYLAIFEAIADIESPDVEDALGSPVVLLALSLDAKLAVGHWPIVGHRPVAAGMPLPAFKEAVGSPDQVDVVDFSGTQRRPATAKEASILPNRTVVAPVLLEKAVRAREGLEPWRAAFNDLVPNRELSTERLFG